MSTSDFNHSIVILSRADGEGSQDLLDATWRAELQRFLTSLGMTIPGLWL